MTTSWDLGDDEPVAPDRKRPPREPRAKKPGATQGAPQAARTTSRRRGWMVWTAVAAVVIVAGAGGAWWFANRDAGARATAEAYLEALAAGDGQTLADIVADAGSEETVAAFAEASEYISLPSLDDLDVDGDRAAATATATLGDESLDLRFEMTRDDDGWAIDGTSLLTTLAEPAGTLAIGSLELPAGDPIALLPARYEVTAVPSEIVEGSESVRILPSEEPQTIAVATRAADGADAVAQQYLDAYAEECTEPAEDLPDACGIVVPWAADLVELERVYFRVERVPQIELDLTTGRFAATGGIIEATAHGITHEGVTASFDYRAEDWAMRGSVRFEGAQLRLSVF